MSPEEKPRNSEEEEERPKKSGRELSPRDYDDPYWLVVGDEMES